MTGDDGAFHAFERRGWSEPALSKGYHDHLAPVTMQAVEPLLDAAGTRAGDRVVDVATGAGYAAAAAARRGAEAIGVDFSDSQLALARELYPDVAFRDGDASALPFDDASLDAVISNFGMPHFPDPDAFLKEAFRALRNRGRVAFSAWAPPSECLGFGLIYEAVQAFGRMDVPLPPGPSFFMFSEREQCERSLRNAGFSSIKVIRVPQVWRAPSADHVFDAIAQGTVRAAALLREQSAEAEAAIRRAVRDGMAGYVRNGEIALPMPAVIASGIKP
jgi:SAM-dependent methyltransferase